MELKIFLFWCIYLVDILVDCAITTTSKELDIVTNTGINVNYGRATKLTDQHLKIKYEKGSICKVSVLKVNPFSSRIGAFVPSVFPCDFAPNSIYYQHFGSMSRSTEKIKLQIRVDTEHDTYLKSFEFTVNIGLYEPFEILKRVENLVVDEIGGLSEPFSENVIGLRFDPYKHTCRVRFLSTQGGPPYYGSLVNASDPDGFGQVSNFKDISCHRFLNGNLRYAHQRSRRTSNRDYLPFVIELYDKFTSLMDKREFIQIPVRIRRAPENQPPIVNYNHASYSLQVDQLVLTALTPAVLRVEDRETDSDSIVFNITQKYDENDGYLVHTDDPSSPVRTFYQKDIRDLKIAYKASDKLSTTQRMQPIYMEARDSYGAASSKFYIIIVIKPMNSFAPRVIRNEVLTMFEGQSRLVSRDVLSVRDPDNEADVVIRVSDGLKNGRLEMYGKSVTKMSVADIAGKRIRYVHDGSDTTSDNIVFHISDGKHTVQVLFVVLIVPRDDQPPQLTYNTGLNVKEGETKMIGQFLLSATDIDSDNTKITYKIIKAPSAGILVYRQIDTPNDFARRERQWRLTNSSYERIVTEFTQVDVILGRIFYRHSGEEIFQDMFTFRLSDNTNVPNQSGIKTFIIVIDPVDDLPPTPYPGCPFTLNTAENQPGIFTKKSLRYVDGDSSDEEITYRITSQPYFENSGTNAGKLFISRKGQSEIADSFTQKYINHFKVKYVPNTLLQSIIQSSKVIFKYDVTDSAGNLRANQNFSIDLRAVKNKPPVYQTNSVLQVKSEGSQVITTAQLNAQDDDSELKDLVFIVKKLPLYGVLTNSSYRQSVGSSISLIDIRESRVTYLHGGNDATDDVIKFMLTDGINMVGVQLRINIIHGQSTLSKESRKPRIFENRLNVEENGIIEIGSKTFGLPTFVEDDEIDHQLTFKVDPPPKHGQIERKGASTNIFTLEDIASGQIAYHHTDGEVGTQKLQDLINLNIPQNDQDIFIGGQLYSGLTLTVDIAPVNSQPPKIDGPLLIEVVESKKSILKINISDSDTSPENINCNVTELPLFGFIENLTPLDGSEIQRPNIPVEKFRVSDLNQGRVSYVQSKHNKIEPDMDSFNLRCFDGNNTSSEVKVHVSIAPINDEPPVLFIQSQIVCIEDDLIIFDLSKINPFDRDRPTDELVIFVTKQPINGELLLQNNSALNPATDFGYEVLSGDTDITLIYQHKGTETTKDQFELSVFDGVHTTEGMVNITIIPMDDEQPRLVVNTGLRIDRGQSKTITTSNLKAQDLDSEDSQLMYIVMMESISGKLQKLNTSQLYTDLVKGNNFTQTDIDKKRIRYTHLNMKSEDRDLIRLDVTDGFNRLINQIFNIIITPEDNIIPVVVNKGLRLLENSRAILTTDVLSASDINTPDENLQFIVTRLPLKGFLEHSDRSGIPLTRFTQLDLAANKISYLHTSLDEIKADNFEFEVTDGQNKVFRTFRIHIDSVDNKLPVLQKSIVYTGQGQEKIITPFELNAYDNDTKLNNVIFQIHRPPRHGVIYLDGITRTFRFTQQDITENRLSYQHDGSMGTIDSFTVAAGDGVNEGYYLKGSKRIQKRPTTVQIEITAIDKNAPVIVTNKLITSLRVRRKKIFTKLSINVLEAVDSHSESNSIIFNITGHPKEGKLINVKNKGVTITQFSQDDVNNRIIEYLLNGSSSATNDIFFFDVLDGNGNALRGQNLKLKWSRVCIHQDQVTVQETDSKADLKFKRFGNLQTSAFATMVIKQEFDTDNKAFVESEKVVHWKSGKDIASTSLQLIDDVFYDNMRTVSVTLKDGVNTLIGDGCNMTVSITDPEDEPIVSMVGSEFKINESIDVLKILLQRKGDAKKLTKVYCITESDSARGTSGYAVTSYHDYISRFDEEEPSIVTFEEGEVEKICEIKIIDDTTYEIDEEFKVFLKPLFGGLINESQSDGVVTILNDPKDELEFSLEKTEYKVSEDIGFIRLNVKRTGLDRSFKSYVQIMTKEHVPLSAKSNDDYKGIFKTLEFGIGVTSIQVNLQIYDDEYRPKMEGEESFNVELRNPRNGRLSSTHSKAIVTIHDLENDVPKVGFEKDEYEFDENAGVIKIPIQREGDLSQEVSVLCYTRQSSARVVDDFNERPKSYTSMIKFKRFEKTKYCKVKLVDDNVYEKDEIFYIWLDRVYYNVRITMNNRTRIIIKDNDKPQVFFSEKKYYFYEPSKEEKESIVYVIVERDGDVTKPTSVSLETNDGSAISGRHYEPFARMLKFDAGISRLSVPIKLYHSKKVNVRLAFTLSLKRHPDDALSLIRERKAVVSIEERRVRSDVTFPLNPMVVSLTDYADVSKAKKEAVNGYPLICVTACDTHFPMYDKTNAICNQERIINNMTVYRWQIQSDDVIGGYRDISLPVFFTKTSTITLDSIYFTAKSRVRCIARAYSLDGGLGLESKSQVIGISEKEGICKPRNTARLAENTFSAQVSYTGNDDPHHKNMIKLSVLIPHYDGLLPVVSTKRPSNFDLILSADPSRYKQHTCSNLLNENEVTTKNGFLSSSIQRNIFSSHPFEFDKRLRSANSVKFYENLNLDSCLWTFESYYDMNELVTLCGGNIVSEGLVANSVQSNLVLNIPLFVSYLYPSKSGRFIEYNHESSFRLTAVYDTGALWSDGVGLASGKLEGSLYPASIIVLNKDNRLLFKFKTKTAFRGVFIKETEDGERKSSIQSRDQPLLTFTLRHIKSEETFNEPIQEWEMTSDMAVRDYSGMYIFNLIPCVVQTDIDFSWPPQCVPQEEVTFEVPLSIHQTSKPVETSFTLNTRFIVAKEDQTTMENELPDNVAFDEGDNIFGRVLVSNDEKAYRVKIEKVLLCAGQDGYIPIFNPDNKEFGCLVDTNRLMYRLQILNRVNPGHETREFGRVPFKAAFTKKKGASDGFKMDSTPLFKAGNGRTWYLHVVYKVRSKRKNKNKRQRRDIDDDDEFDDVTDDVIMHHVTSDISQNELTGRRSKREINDNSKEIKSIGRKKGTNLKMLTLNRPKVEYIFEKEETYVKRKSKNPQLLYGLIGGFMVLLIVAVGVVMYRRFFMITAIPVPHETAL